MNTFERAAQQWYILTYQNWDKNGGPSTHSYVTLSDRWTALYGKDAEWAAWRIAKGPENCYI